MEVICFSAEDAAYARLKDRCAIGKKQIPPLSAAADSGRDDRVVVIPSSQSLVHRERSLARFVRQTKSKDLLLGHQSYETNFRDTTASQREQLAEKLKAIALAERDNTQNAANARPGRREKVVLLHIQPGRRMQNGYVDSFHGSVAFLRQC